jgi:CheY-specific phosphatase CheX
MTIPADLLSNLMTSTEDVFETMVFKPLVRMPPLDGEGDKKGASVVATVAFAGHRRGLVAIHSSIDAARNIACAMLGIPEDEITGEIPDAMGEVPTWLRARSATSWRRSSRPQRSRSRR